MRLVRKSVSRFRQSTIARYQGNLEVSRIAEIDGLRGIAVLFVLIFHLDSNLLPNGYLGVDIFFVISGFVIARSLSKSIEGPLLKTLKLFYFRRVVRLLPAFLFYTICLSIFSSLFIPSGWLSQGIHETATWGTFSGANFFLSKHADGYFSERIMFNPFMHLWSLSIENQFYLIFPLFFWAFYKYGKKFRTALSISLMLLIFFGFSVLEESGVANYYNPFLRFLEIAVGVSVFSIKRSRLFRDFNSQTAIFMSKLCYFAIFIVVIFLSQVSSHFLKAFLVCAFTGLFLLSLSYHLQDKTSQGIKSLRSGVFNYLGRISYSLYLWHWGVISLSNWTIGSIGIQNKVLIFTLVITISHFSWSFFEVKIPSILKSNSTETSLPSKYRFRKWLAIALSCQAFIVSFNWNSFSLSNSDKVQTWELAENSSSSADSSYDGILKGRRLVIVGDSHAGAYSLLADFAAIDLGLDTTIISSPGCPIISLVGNYIDESNCVGDYQKILELILNSTKEGDFVMFSSLRSPRISNQWGSFDIEAIIKNVNSQENLKRINAELEQSIQLVKQIEFEDRIVIIDLPKPVFSAPIFRCLDWFNRINPVCDPGFATSKESLSRLQSPTLRALSKLEENTNIYTWNPTRILCPHEICSVFAEIKKGILFFDGDHLSNAGNQILRLDFVEMLAQIGRKEGVALG